MCKQVLSIQANGLKVSYVIRLTGMGRENWVLPGQHMLSDYYKEYCLLTCHVL